MQGPGETDPVAGLPAQEVFAAGELGMEWIETDRDSAADQTRQPVRDTSANQESVTTLLPARVELISSVSCHPTCSCESTGYTRDSHHGTKTQQDEFGGGGRVTSGLFSGRYCTAGFE